MVKKLGHVTRTNLAEGTYETTKLDITTKEETNKKQTTMKRREITKIKRINLT